MLLNKHALLPSPRYRNVVRASAFLHISPSLYRKRFLSHILSLPHLHGILYPSPSPPEVSFFLLIPALPPPFFKYTKTPLLAWDLNTLVVGGVSMARSWSSRAGIARTVCLARLCQALLQPELCLRGPGGAAAAATSMSGGWGPRGQVRDFAFTHISLCFYFAFFFCNLSCNFLALLSSVWLAWFDCLSSSLVLYCLVLSRLSSCF